MIDMASALNDLRDEIQAKTPARKAVSYTAGVYGAKEEVLRIRFEKAFGMTPEQMEEQQAGIVPRDLIAEAVEIARAHAATCTLPAWQHAALGKPFWFMGEKFVFAAYVTGSYGLRGVKVDTGHLMQLKGGTVSKIVRELSRN